MTFYCKLCEKLINPEMPASRACKEDCFNSGGPPEIKKIGDVSVPVFLRQEKGMNEFSIDNAGEIHDNAMQWLHDVHGTTESSLRTELVANFAVTSTSASRILVTSIGAGNDLKYLIAAHPDAKFYLQDIAFEMLEAAVNRNRQIISKHNVTFFVGDALDLPFADNFFDAAYHFGGINLFSDVKKGLHETHRVVKVGGVIQFGDEGIAEWLRNHEIGDVLINNNALYARRVPVDLLPLGIEDFSLKYLFNNCFYLVRYLKADGPKINLDVPHQGRRGGTLRSRYYGKLEGISPEIRDRVNEIASHQNLSRVQFLEMVLQEVIRKNDSV